MNGFANPTPRALCLAPQMLDAYHPISAKKLKVSKRPKRAYCFLDAKGLVSNRLAEGLICVRNEASRTIENKDRAYLHTAPRALNHSQLTDGIALEIAHSVDPQFKPEGRAID